MKIIHFPNRKQNLATYMQYSVLNPITILARVLAITCPNFILFLLKLTKIDYIISINMLKTQQYIFMSRHLLCNELTCMNEKTNSGGEETTRLAKGFFTEIKPWTRVFFLIVTAITILANSLLLFAILKDPLKCFRNSTSYFVVRLAVTDLLNQCSFWKSHSTKFGGIDGLQYSLKILTYFPIEMLFLLILNQYSALQQNAVQASCILWGIKSMLLQEHDTRGQLKYGSEVAC